MRSRARRAAIRDFMAEVKGALDGLCSMPNARVGKLAMSVRNHQDIVDVGEFFRFLGIFMRRRGEFVV